MQYKKAILLVIVSFILTIQLNAQQSITGPTRPVGVSEGIITNNNKSAVIISGVPAYLWHCGCGPTALGMLIGYYDAHGFPDLIDGDASTQTNSVNDAIANVEHYNDYSLPIDYPPNLLQDKSDLGSAHTSNCIADFMETSWSSKSNFWGYSWSDRIDDAFSHYVSMKNSEYITFTTYEYFSDLTSWDVYTNEIDNNRPVVLVVDTDGDGSTDHFVTGIGYDESNMTYGILDTWSSNIHWYDWRELSTDYSWGIYGFNILLFYFNINASANPTGGGLIGGVGYYNINQIAHMSATESTGYDFVNWTANDIVVATTNNYSFIVTENRWLVANFVPETSNVDLNDNTKINIYPNPVNDEFTIEAQKCQDILNFEIINSMGIIVYKGDLVNKTKVQVGSFAPGVYLIKLANGKTFECKKIIKE